MIQILIILVPVIVMTVAVPWLRQRLNTRHFCVLVALVGAVYLLGNLYFTLLSRTPGSGAELALEPFWTYRSLFEPLEETQDQLEMTNQITGLAGALLKDTLPIEGLILNVLLYYPMGYLLMVLFPRLKARQVILIGTACSLGTEITQYLLEMGWMDVDDLIHNVLGVAIGVWVWHRQCKPAVNPAEKEK